MSSATVRISPPVHEKLKRIAGARRDVVARLGNGRGIVPPANAIGGNQPRHPALRSDPERWAEEQEERRLGGDFGQRP